MDDFSSRPGVPNAFGLIGAEANAVAPVKRPLSSMSPTIVLKNGKPVMTVGGAGGPKIITEVLLAIVRFIDGQQDVHSAIAAPRIHHQWRPDMLFVEASLDAQLIEALRNYGHKIQVLERAGVAQAISQLPDGPFMGQADPRVPSKAAGY
jgi:gamma-glutamyltranspeptidase/glutathione hydrolase